jgi:hypothetical protein
VFGEPPFDYVFGDRCLPLASAHVDIATPRRHGTLYLVVAMCYIGSDRGSISLGLGPAQLIVFCLLTSKYFLPGLCTYGARAACEERQYGG